MNPGDMFNKFKMKKKNWIAGAIKKPGALHKELGVKKGTKIPAKKLASAAKKGGKEGKRARLAQTLKSFKHKKTMKNDHDADDKMKTKKKSGLRPASAVVKSEQNASHQFYKKNKK